MLWALILVPFNFCILVKGPIRPYTIPLVGQKLSIFKSLSLYAIFVTLVFGILVFVFSIIFWSTPEYSMFKLLSPPKQGVMFLLAFIHSFVFEQDNSKKWRMDSDEKKNIQERQEMA